MDKSYFVEIDGKECTLRDCIELLALSICENVIKDEQRTENVMRKCKLLDSLSNALQAIKS